MQHPANGSGTLRGIDFASFYHPLREFLRGHLPQIGTFLFWQSQDERCGTNFQSCDPCLGLLCGPHRHFIGAQDRLIGQPDTQFDAASVGSFAAPMQLRGADDPSALLVSAMVEDFRIVCPTITHMQILHVGRWSSYAVDQTSPNFGFSGALRSAVRILLGVFSRFAIKQLLSY